MNNPRKYGHEPFGLAVIHGGPGAPGEMAPVARELSTDLGVLEPLQTANTVDGQVEELRAALEKDGSLPLILIGFSWGAWLSCILAARYPAFVKKLILVSSPPFQEKYAANIMKTRLGRLSAAEQDEARSLMDALEYQASPDTRTMARFGELMTKADAYDPLPDKTGPVEFNPDVFRQVWTQASRLRSSGELMKLAGRIKCPVVAIHGDYDPHPARGVEEPLSHVMRDFRFTLLEKCGHRPWLERHAAQRFYSLLGDEIGLGGRRRNPQANTLS